MKHVICMMIWWTCCTSAFGQIAPPDTIYIYETVTVYDTIVIHDTIRLNKKLIIPGTPSNGDTTTFFDALTATFSKNGIILHENNHQKRITTMKFHIGNYVSAFIVSAQSMVGLSAQETQPADDLPTFPIQMSIVYPMTTQGNKTVDYRYNVSFNLFSGKVGAVKGIEYGSFFNRVERNVTGVQVSGLFNMTRDLTGIQFGGLANASKVTKGIQFGGLGNITGSTSGIQFGGIANIGESVKGVQFGGIANITGNASGLQFGGIANLSEHSKGIQISGITNITEESDGFQFAGIANISNEVSGASIGGIFNRTGTLKGFQFGIVNVTDTIEKGISMALVNIVKQGFYGAWELSFSDYVNVGLSYKMGIQKFYTIYSIGANFIEDKLWVAGIGFGNRTSLGKRLDFQPEIISYNYYPKDFKNIQSTWSTHLKLGFIYRLNDKLGILFTPSIYHINADTKDGSDAYKVSPIAPIYSSKGSNYINSIGVGFSIGLILK